MRKRIILGVSLLFSALLVLTTCQFQFNKLGNGLTLRVVVPQKLSGGTKSTAASTASPRSLAHGDTVTVTVGPASGSPVGALAAQAAKQRAAAAPTDTQTQTSPVNGQASLDFSFSLSSGSYSVTAVMTDANGDTLAQGTTQFSVPTGNYPVVLPMYSSLLFDVVVADSTGATYVFTPPISPVIFDYGPSINVILSNNLYTYTLTLMTVDPNATVTSVTETEAFQTVPPPSVTDPHVGSAYTLTLAYYQNLITVEITGQDGTTQVYTMIIQATWHG